MRTCSVCYTLMVFYCLVYFCFAHQQKNPSLMSAFKPGDVIIGGLLPIHSSNGTASCGPLYAFGFQLAEAMIVTVEKINNDKSLLPNITLGFDIRDYCSDSGLAMKHAYSLLRIKSTPVRAIFGPPFSGEAVLVGSLLQVFDVPGVSVATSDELSGPLYRSFFRTVPPDTQQAKAMADIIEHFRWSYVAAVADDDSYGRNGIAALEKESIKRGTFCLAFSEFVKGFDFQKQIEVIVEKIISKQTIKVVILWNEAGVLERILREAKKQGLKDRIWFFSDYIGTNIIKMFDQYRNTVVGSLGVTPSFFRDPYYQAHLKNITPLKTRSLYNPWWDEVWRSLYGCTTKVSGSKEKLCDNNLKLSEETIANVLYSSYISYMSDGVMAVARALHKAMYECRKGVCTRKNATLTPEKLTAYLRKSSFQGLTGSIQFNPKGDPLSASYEVVNIQFSSPNGSLKITNVGSWKNGFLRLNESKILWKSGTAMIPKSVCRDQCPPGTLQTTPVECCWECIKCSKGTFSSGYGWNNCSECREDQKSNSDATGCVYLPIKNAAWSDASSVTCTLLASGGILLIAFTLGVFIKYRKTPLIKASNYHLSIFLLFLIASCFVLSIIYLAAPSDVLCRLLEFWRCVVLIMCVSVLLIKTVRLMCVFEMPFFNNAFKTYARSKYSQLIFAVLINTLEISLSIAWLAVDPPYLHKKINTDKNVFFVCRPYKNLLGKALSLIVLVYLFLIGFLCTCCAVIVRNLPENFNEAKYIGFSMYILLLSWLTYYPVQSALENWYVVIISSATLLLSSYGLLGCMFGPKLYVVLLHPERNTKEQVQTSISNYTFSNTSNSNIASMPNNIKRNMQVVQQSNKTTSQVSLDDVTRASK